MCVPVFEEKVLKHLEGHGGDNKSCKKVIHILYKKEPEYPSFYFQKLSWNVDTYALLHLINNFQVFAFHFSINLLLPKGLIGIRGLSQGQNTKQKGQEESNLTFQGNILKQQKQVPLLYKLPSTWVWFYY